MGSEVGAELTFEQALSKLEELVLAMESGEVPLAELVARFEEGNKLLRTCQSCLNDAELKIERLKRDNGSFKAEPFGEPDEGEIIE